VCAQKPTKKKKKKKRSRVGVGVARAPNNPAVIIVVGGDYVINEISSIFA
jgi:hypothetical protein